MIRPGWQWLFLGFSVVIFGNAAWGQAPAPTAPPPSKTPEPTSKADARGTELLESAVKALDPKTVPWLEMAVWQRAEYQGRPVRSEGRYISGPGDRVHLELNVYLGDTVAHFLTSSDGATLWERTQVGDDGPVQIDRTDWKKVAEFIDNISMLEQVRTEVRQSGAFMGVLPLLQGIRRNMIITEHEIADWHGRAVHKLTARWSPEITKNMMAQRPQWPQLMPRRCVVLLDAGTSRLWPHRIEWWGPTPGVNSDVLLLQLEFRDPRFGKQYSDEKYARLFHFDPGHYVVRDQTKNLIDGAKKLRSALATQRDQRPPGQ